MASGDRLDQDQERFEPVKIKTSRSTTRRVAIFIFIASGALFSLLALAIVNSGDDLVSSDAPAEIIEPARASSVILPPPPQPRQPEPEPTQEPEPASTQETQTRQPQAQVQPQAQPAQLLQPDQPEVRRAVRPAYAPAPRGDRARNVTEGRRQTQLQRLQAASAPTAIQGFTPQAQGGQGAASLLNSAEGTFPDAAGAQQQQATGSMALTQPGMPEVGSDPNGWARKEAFRQQALPAEYSQHTRAFPVSALELKAGSIMPCVLISGLNSDLPGNLIAQVSENIWDTATGRYLLIPRGSRLVGTYDHQISYGQNRALVIWSRLIFPDGSSLLLDNLQGADPSGYTGFKGRVDRHWGQMLTSALLVSLIGAGVELAEPNHNNNSGSNNNNNNRSVGNILSERVAQAIAEVMTQIIAKGMNRQPTILIKPGYRFMIFVQHDVVFPRVWNVAQDR